MVLIRVNQLYKLCISQSSTYNNMQNQIQIKRVDLHIPDRTALRDVLTCRLKEHYRDVSVEWVPCPNLTLKPFYLAAPGLCGNTALVKIGDSSYTRESLTQAKIYDIKKDILKPLGYYQNSFIFGNGIDYVPFRRSFREIVINAFYSPKLPEKMTLLPNLQTEMTLQNKSSIILKSGYQCQVKRLIQPNLICRGQGCFFLCNGFFNFLNYVLKVNAKNKRTPLVTSNSEFIDAMQYKLQKTYGSKYNVALGGVVYVANNPSKIGLNYSWKHHFVPNNWESGINYKNTCTIDLPDTIVSTFHSETKLTSVSSEPSIELSNLQSTHSLFHHSSAQRYFVPGQIDININDIEYLGYFCPAEKLYRIDEPLSIT